MNNFLIFEEKSHSRDNNKILHSFFRPTDSGFCIVRLEVFFIEDHIKKKDVYRTTLREVMRF